MTNEWSDPLHTFNIGASYALSDRRTLFGNIAWGQLASEPGMLTADFQRPGSEDRLKVDLGFRQIVETFGEISLTGFYVRRDNAPLVSNSTVTLDDVDYALYASEDQDNYGIELDIKSIRYKNGIQFFLNSTLMKTKRTQDGTWRDDKEVPEFVLNGGITYIFKKFELGIYAKHVSEYENNRFLPGGSDPAPLGDYSEYTGQVTYYHNLNTRLYVRVENMTDDEYSTVAGYPNDGVKFSTGLMMRF